MADKKTNDDASIYLSPARPRACGACVNRDTLLPLAFETLDTWPATEAAIIDAGLDASNMASAPLSDVRPMACVARAPSGAVVGGALGRTWGACAELQQLWVAPAQRRKGVASQLVRRFESGVMARGCQTFYLTTFSFQAPALYLTLGYEIAAQLPGFPEGIVKFLMVRSVMPPKPA